MQLRLELAASVAKDPLRPEANEDVYELGGNCFALADGASESYDSQTWAKMLSSKFILDQQVNAQWIAERVKTYADATDFQSLSWSRRAAFDRGSFATLLGLKLVSDGSGVQILSVGDSLALHVRDGVMINSFPFTKHEEFDARPQLMSTLGAANYFVDTPEFLALKSTTWQITAGDKVLLVTDAVGHWILAQNDVLKDLNSVISAGEFEQLVISKRIARTMRLDDSSVLRFLVIDNDEQPQL